MARPSLPPASPLILPKPYGSTCRSPKPSLARHRSYRNRLVAAYRPRRVTPPRRGRIPRSKGSPGQCQIWALLTFGGTDNATVKKEHRRELYSPVSRDALRVPDVAGPDGVRVTLRVEPAVDRFRRWRFMVSTPAVLTDPAFAYVSYRVLPDLVQRFVLRDRWAVDVEADNGQRCRVGARSRDDAIDYARKIHDGVADAGVAFLRIFAR
jgi:hypothetical protein